MFQYKRCLKTERYVRVQVVLLLTLILIYQDYYLEVVSKYGGRDTSESSLVFSDSKGWEAKSAGHYFHIPQSQTLKLFIWTKNHLKIIKAKVLVSYGRKIPT